MSLNCICCITHLNMQLVVSKHLTQCPEVIFRGAEVWVGQGHGAGLRTQGDFSWHFNRIILHYGNVLSVAYLLTLPTVVTLYQAAELAAAIVGPSLGASSYILYWARFSTHTRSRHQVWWLQFAPHQYEATRVYNHGVVTSAKCTGHHHDCVSHNIIINTLKLFWRSRVSS